MSSDIKISIITPSYNYANFIDQTIESIITQSYDNWEHIIVDDGSTDNSVEIIAGYQRQYPGKIKLIKQSNQGQTRAINNALSFVTGDVIGWINADDLFVDNAFKIAIDEFNKNSTLEAVFGDIFIIDKDGKKIKKNKYLPFDYTSGVFNGFGKIIPSNAIFWKTTLTKETGKLNNNYDYAMDAEYWSRLLYKRRVKHIKVPLAMFRWHEDAKTIKKKVKSGTSHLKSKNEDIVIFNNAYNKLKISKIIPFAIGQHIKILYKLKRYFLRFINGHYNQKK